MSDFFKSRVSPALSLADVGGGAHKRVDEIRELLELLQSRVPAFAGLMLVDHGMVAGQ